MPFRTGRGFGNWIFSTLALQPYAYFYIQAMVMKYFRDEDLKRFVRAVRFFRGPYNRICYLQGVFMVAISLSHKMYVEKKLVKELMRQKNSK